MTNCEEEALRRTIWSDVLFTAAILAGAPALAHRFFGIRMVQWPLPVTDLSWVNEPLWWSLAAVLTIAGAVVGRAAVSTETRERADLVR